jgi:hypothetical protein
MSAVNERRTRAWTHIGVALVASQLTACGIDQGGVAPPQVVSQNTVLSGPITGFGSVIVNGVTLDTSRAQIRIDGRSGAQDELRVGQVIRAIVTSDRGTTTVLIEYEENVVGPVGAIDVGSGTFTVLGQVVTTSAATQFDAAQQLAALTDLHTGDRVVVSGLVAPSGRIFATYVGRAPASVPFQVTAPITALDVPSLTFELGDLAIDYSRAAVVELGGGQPQLNTFVEVTGTSVVDGELVAERVRSLPTVPWLFTAASTTESVAASPSFGAVTTPATRNVNFVGFITAGIAAGTIALGDVGVSIGGSTVIVDGSSANLVAGARVQVEGQIVSPGRIQATRISVL